jgi:hypothetical protein
MQENQKPKVRLIGKDGNIFNLIAVASRALKNCGQAKKAEEMTTRVYASGSYHEALSIILEYVDEAGNDVAYDEEDDYGVFNYDGDECCSEDEVDEDENFD